MGHLYHGYVSHNQRVSNGGFFWSAQLETSALQDLLGGSKRTPPSKKKKTQEFNQHIQTAKNLADDMAMLNSQPILHPILLGR